jgi:putative Ca2+/H+ antiporter (TMEM165/GDT1 family)
VVTGTTLGVLLANAPVVSIAYKAAPRLPVKAIRIVAAALFIVLGIARSLHDAEKARSYPGFFY